MEIVTNTPDGGSKDIRQQCYVLEGVGMLFLSYEALVDLGCCPEGFPMVAGAFVIGDQHWAQQESGPCPQGQVEEPSPCKCLDRALPPDPPIIPSSRETASWWILRGAGYLPTRKLTSVFHFQ